MHHFNDKGSTTVKIYECISNEIELFDRITGVLFPEKSKEKILIYDIDTTSFEAANGCIFLIGAMYFKDQELKLEQFFSESIDEEAVIIRRFIELAECFDVLLSYKGDSFDIPYIGKRLYTLQEKTLYSRLQELRFRSVDIFEEIHAIKPLIGFTSTKLDYLRKKLGQDVSERINGENISKFYVEHISAAKLKALREVSNSPDNTGFISDYEPKPVADELSHISVDSGDRFLEEILLRNRENIEAVLYLGKLGHIFNMHKGLYEVSASKYRESQDMALIIYLDNDLASSRKIIRNLKVVKLNLKQFFINYRDYYFFPAEDMAMHKSVAEFADKASRKKATPQTAYSKVNGSFVKIPPSFVKAENKKEGCLYKESYESENYYLPVDSILNMNNDQLKQFAYYCILDSCKENLSIILDFC